MPKKTPPRTFLFPAEKPRLAPTTRPDPMPRRPRTRLTHKQSQTLVDTPNGIIPLGSLTKEELQLALYDAIKTAEAVDKRLIRAAAILNDCLP